MKGRRFRCLIRQNRIVSSRVRELSGSRRRDRLCENSSPAGDRGKTTSTVSIWHVFFGGEGSENPFFVLPKCHFGVFAQPGEEADTREIEKSASSRRRLPEFQQFSGSL